MTDHQGYSPRNRTERVIAVGRLFLAGFLLLAVITQVSQLAASAALLERISAGYLVYAAGMGLWMWRSRATPRAVPFATHVVDLIVFSMVMRLTAGPTSPFFVYFVFATICGALRWHGPGALLTGGAVLAAYVALTLTGEDVFGAPEFDSVRFITRCTHLAIVTGLLAYLGAYQARLQREIEGLAAWPRRLPVRESEAIHELLTYAARVLGTPRVVLAWEEEDEPSLRVASLLGGAFDTARLPPNAFGSIVAIELRRTSFLCADLGASSCAVLHRVPAGFDLWHGAPLDWAFRARYGPRSVLGLRLATSKIDGWLFAFDRRALSSDDLLLGDIVGRLVSSALELNAVFAQLRETAAGDERVRLARELHDGVLQSLTAAALQTQRARQAIASNPEEADRRLATIEQTILGEQQALRLAIADLRPGSLRAALVHDAADRIRDAADRVAAQWDVRVVVDVYPDIPPVPQRIAHEIARMAQESLVNAVRHGAATRIHLELAAADRVLQLTLSYEGQGFASFTGRKDLAALQAMEAGPRTLKERVAGLRGSLVIDSTDGRVRIEVRIPVTLRAADAG